MCSFWHAHICINTNPKPFVWRKEIVWLLARNSPLAFLKELNTSDLLSFALIISSDESQSEAKFILLGVGENKTRYRAENMKFVSKDANLMKCPHLFTLHFMPTWKCTAMASNASSPPWALAGGSRGALPSVFWNLTF